MSVLTEHRDGSLVLTINRPEAGNALNGEVGSALVAALTAAADDPDVRSLIITGAGEKIFCAGMDLKAFAAGEDVSTVGDGLRLLGEFAKPVIAAVNGSAVAGGFEVMLGADLVVAADHAKFGIPEVKRGLVAGGGGTRLASRIPLQVALELGLTGETISAARALELGLVNRVVPASEVVDTALGLAALINANGPLAVKATKRLIRAELGEEDQQRLAEVLAPVFSSEDAKEGARAFAERRPPQWKGR
jgi:enoyl-CoA hydratase